MAAAIFNVLYNALLSAANTILFPINTLLATFVPSLTQAISTITSAINLYLGSGLVYFFNILPPNARYFVIFYLSFLVVYYTASYTTHAVIWLLNIIKKLPLA